ncbi:MAG: gamma-glutamyl-gamma-aminobutyrate hydrolase family protein [Bryobacteraceae bacterium]
MSVLAIRHVPFEHLGAIAGVLDRGQISYRYVDAPESAPALDGVQGLIFMGGPMSANDDLPYIHTEMTLIQEAAARGIPVLGVCLGAQLIAKALGARVYRNPQKEIGWFPIEWTGATRRDPLFTGFVEPETVFHWHGETFDLPEGAAWLASSAACRHQAFRAGENIYGLQFHVEATPEMIADWCGQDSNCGDVRELTAPIDPHAHAQRQRELAEVVFTRWVRQFVRRAL